MKIRILLSGLLAALVLAPLLGGAAGAEGALPLEAPLLLGSICFTHADTFRHACCDALDLTPDEIGMCVAIQSPEGWSNLDPTDPSKADRPCYAGQRCTKVKQSAGSSTGLVECYQTWTESESSCEAGLGRTVRAKSLYTYVKGGTTTGSVHAFTTNGIPQFAMFKVYRNGSPVAAAPCFGYEEGNRLTTGVGGTFTNDYSACGGTPARGSWGAGMAYEE